MKKYYKMSAKGSMFLVKAANIDEANKILKRESIDYQMLSVGGHTAQLFEETGEVFGNIQAHARTAQQTRYDLTITEALNTFKTSEFLKGLNINYYKLQNN